MKWQDQTSAYHHILLIVTVIFSNLVDCDFLSSKYFPEPLGEESDNFAYRIKQEESSTRSFAWYGLLINILIKMISLNESLKASTQGRVIREIFWEKGSLFFVTRHIPKDLNVAVRRRIVAIAWIEFICSLLFFAYFFAIHFDGVSSTHLQYNTMLSLKGTLLLKGSSGLFVFMSLYHHISMKEFCSQFGCSSFCPIFFETPSPERGRGKGRILANVDKSLPCIIFMKSVDVSIGVLLWIGLVSVQKENSSGNAPKEESTLMGLIFATQMFTHILVLILGSVVVWCVESINESVRFLILIAKFSEMAQTMPLFHSVPVKGTSKYLNRVKTSFARKQWLKILRMA